MPGVDVALVGPEDLSVSLGVPGESTHPRVIEAVETMIESAKRNHVVSAIHGGSVEFLQGWLEKGMGMIMYASDLDFLMPSKAELDRLRAST